MSAETTFKKEAQKTAKKMIEKAKNQCTQEQVKYAITRKQRGYNPNLYEFVSKLGSKIPGINEAIRYMTLKEAMHYNSAKEAYAALRSQPDWVREQHRVIQFVDYGTGSFRTFPHGKKSKTTN